MAGTLEVFCYGEIGVDNIIQAERLPTPEIAVFPNEDTYHIGGAAANTAVWLSHLGVRVGFTGNVIGTDLYGDWLWAWLQQHPNLDLRLVERRSNASTPFTRAIVTPDGERSFLIFHYPQSPKIAFSAPMLQGARFFALDLYGGPERMQAAETAHAGGAEIVISDVIEASHPVLPLTGVLINSGTYLRNMLPGVNVRQHARELREINQGVVIVTDGPNGVFAIDRQGGEFTLQPPRVTVVDATGAGDAFRAGLMFGLLKGFDLSRSLCFGVAAGSLKVRHAGAASVLPTLQEVDTLASNIEVQCA
jgi:sugar/nucleoside kinase (ribokinase family)